MSFQSAQLTRIPAQSGAALRLSRGDILRVIDPAGEQVADLFAYAAEDTRECLSSGRSIDYAETIRLSTGNILYSNRSRAMLTIVRDDVGRHDFLLTPCSHETFVIIYKEAGEHPSCLENLVHALQPYGLDADTISTTFNIFMNVELADNGEITVCPPTSTGGDAIEFRAEMDLIVGLTACSAEMSNNFAFKPIDYSIDRANGRA